MKTAQKKQSLDAALAKLEESIEKYALLSGAQAVVLALSGGKDSVLLFHLLRICLARHNVAFSCVHVNHHLRGARAERDARFCEKLCRAWGVECRVMSCDVASFSKEHGLSLEEAARCLRYELLLQVARERGALVATAHTASDQTETVLMQICQGGGLSAAAGIEPRRKDGVIRPLLHFSTEEVLSVVKDCGFRFVQDHTNRDTRFLRNFYRRKVIARLKEKNPALDACVARFASIAREANVALQTFSEKRLKELCLFPVSVRMDLSAIQTLLSEDSDSPVAYALFSEMLRLAGYKEPLTQERFCSIKEYLRTNKRVGAKLEIGGGVGFLLEANTLFATDFFHTEMSQFFPLPLASGECVTDWADNVFSLTPCRECASDEKVHKMHTSIYISCDKLNGSLFVSPCVLSRDYTVNGRTRKVKDYLSMRKYPVGMRGSMPLVCDDTGVIWIPGELPADRVRAEEVGENFRLELIGGDLYEELVIRRQYE